MLIMSITPIWAMYALVDATPISTQALVNIPLSVSRAIVDPSVLTTPKVCAPYFFNHLRGSMRSAVSQD